MGYLEHVVLVGLDRTFTNQVRAFNQSSNNVQQFLTRFGNLGLRFTAGNQWRWKLEHRLGPNVRNTFENSHQLRQIHKSAIPGVGTESATIGRHLNASYGLSKACTPTIEFEDAKLFERYGLQVELDGMKFGQAV